MNDSTLIPVQSPTFRMVNGGVRIGVPLMESTRFDPLTCFSDWNLGHHRETEFESRQRTKALVSEMYLRSMEYEELVQSVLATYGGS